MKRITAVFLLLILLLVGCARQPKQELLQEPPASDPYISMTAQEFSLRSLALQYENVSGTDAAAAILDQVGIPVSDEVFASGEIAYLLQANVTGEDIYDNEGNWIGTAEPRHIWGQEIGKDDYPVLGGMKVYLVTNCDGSTSYSNSPIGFGHTPGADDGDCTTEVLCTVCGQVAIAGNALGHSFENGVCTLCGTADPDHVATPVITLRYPSLSFKDEVLINVYFEASNLEDVVEMGLITYSSQVSSWNINNAEKVISGYHYSESKGLYRVTTEGIPAKNMGDTLWFAIYTKLGDGSYHYTKLVDYSPKLYAYSLLGTDSAELDALLVSMLNYGAAAQLYFGHNTGELVNKDLTAEQKALAPAYSSSMVTTSVSVPADKQGSFASASGYTDRYPSVSFKGAFAINYYCLPEAIPADGITLYYWDKAAYASNVVLTAENASGILAMNALDGGKYVGSVKGIPARKVNDPVYVAFRYSDGTTTYNSGVLPYSIGEYCGYYASIQHEFTSLAQSTAVYGHCAKQYFG